MESIFNCKEKYKRLLRWKKNNGIRKYSNDSIRMNDGGREKHRKVTMFLTRCSEIKNGNEGSTSNRIPFFPPITIFLF